MTDPPTPAAPEPPPDDPAPRPKRPWTILDRLAQAVREQNWFAVALEVCIVIVGVVIGFQITAWGNERADRERERVYLTQLAEDLRETERIVAQRDVRMESTTHHSLDELYLSFGQPQRPPRDSVVRWLRGIGYTAAPNPVLGTTEALVTSGDIGKVRDDSLRTAVVRYLGVTREYVGDQRIYLEEARALRREIRGMTRPAALLDEDIDLREGHVRALLTDADTTGSARSPAWRYPFAHDVYGIYESPEFLETLHEYRRAIRNLHSARRGFTRSAEALREQVETELNR
ncbi:MAG: hypothetical protein R3181_01085 [Rubricoccaceae bacterium]|nr:hypothetical protein [Rubricoccaceae bacterium]